MSSTTCNIMWPRNIDGSMALTEIFAGNCEEIFEKHGVHTVRELIECTGLNDLEIIRINNRLAQCWWQGARSQTVSGQR